MVPCMRSIEEVRRVLALVEQGLNDCEISRETGIPRGTIRDWRHGKTPQRNRRVARWRSRPTVGSCPACGHPEHDFGGLPALEYAYLLGLYLGDGTISKGRRGVFKLRITLDSRYPGIISECFAAVQLVCPTSKVNTITRVGCTEVYSHSRAWPCIFPQHGPGPKHARPIELTSWQHALAAQCPDRLLRGLIHSDGCRVLNRVRVKGKEYTYPRYFFCNHSADIREIFCKYCDLVGIDWRPDGWKNISVARRGSVERLDSFIGPKR
jgi:hypothetical protein